MFIVFSYSTFGIYVLVRCLQMPSKEFQCNCTPCIQEDPGRKASEVPLWWKKDGEKICGLKSQAF